MARRGNRQLFAPRRKKRPGLVAVLLMLLFVLAVLWGLNIAINRSPQMLKQYITVPELRRSMEGLSILHISDLHATRFDEALHQLIAREKYDLVVMSGDMVGRSGHTEPLLQLMDALPDDVPVFLVAGDDDPTPILTTPHGDDEVKAPWIREAEAQGAIYLDRPHRLEVRGGVLWVIPELLYEIDVDAALFSAQSAKQELLAGDNPYAPEAGARLRATEYQIGIMQDAQAARTAMLAQDLCLVVAHVPPGREDVIAMRGDEQAPAYFPGQLALVLAGHLNAGQVRVPGVGALYMPPNRSDAGGWLPPDHLTWGYRNVLGVGIYVSPGLGAGSMHPIPARIFNRPSVTRLSLTSKIR
ncbi:MAG: metallophosphoesterase [Christensenellales bacterium]|jgi:predicted MPP superfamily phosphohydrolase